MRKVMILMLCYNRQPMVKRCLEHLFSHTAEPFDLLIMDDGSGLPIQRMLNELEAMMMPGVTVVRNGTNLGIPNCIKAAQMYRRLGQHWLRIDSDVTMPDDPMWLTNMREILETNMDGIAVLAYPGCGRAVIRSYPGCYESKARLSRPLTSDGRTEVDVWRLDRVAGGSLIHRTFMDGYRFPGHPTLKYGIANDDAVAAYAGEHRYGLA